MKPASVLALIVFACLFACQKKNPESLSPMGMQENSKNTRSTTTGGSTTGSTTSTVSPNFEKILGSTDIAMPSIISRKVYNLNPYTYASGTPFVASFSEGYYGVGAYGGQTCIIAKADGDSTVYLRYNLSSPDDVLTLGSPTGASFLPDEVEMIAPNSSSVYALKGLNIYRIDGIGSGSAYAVLVYTFPTTWLTFKKTIAHSHNSGALKVFIAKTASVFSTVTSLEAYTLSGLTGTPSLSGLEATIGITCTGTNNLSSFSNQTGGFTSDWYHIVIGDAAGNSATTYRLTGTTSYTGSFSTVTPFPTYVNDCSYYFAL